MKRSGKNRAITPRKMESHSATIADVLVITPDVKSDERGFFLQSNQQAKYRATGIRTLFGWRNHPRPGSLHEQRAGKWAATSGRN
jgi:dTDP-4-dehydrorhamnose 3,5-epimerase-like enzyme